MHLRRTLLFTPGDDERLITKAAASTADVCVLELEDAVHSSRKAAARETVARLLSELDWGGHEKVVRVQHIASPEVSEDIDVAIRSGADAIMLPKVDEPDEVKAAARYVDLAEARYGAQPNATKIWVMIESAKALVNVENICASSARLTGLIFGAADFGASIHVKRLALGKEASAIGRGTEYIYARGRIVAAARAFGLDALDTGALAYKDPELTFEAALASAQMGFSGCIAVSPRQLPVIQKAFDPSERDLEWAESVVTSFEKIGREESRAALAVNDDFVDGPFYLNALDIIARHNAAHVNA